MVTVASSTTATVLHGPCLHYKQIPPKSFPESRQGYISMLSERGILKSDRQTPFPSIGSALHPLRECKPCSWFWKPQGCEKGKDCLHCHCCPKGQVKTRRKALIRDLKGVAEPAKVSGKGSAGNFMSNQPSAVFTKNKKAIERTSNAGPAGWPNSTTDAREPTTLLGHPSNLTGKVNHDSVQHILDLQQQLMQVQHQVMQEQFRQLANLNARLPFKRNCTSESNSAEAACVAHSPVFVALAEGTDFSKDLFWI